MLTLFSILLVISSVLCEIEIDCSKNKCFVVKDSKLVAHSDNIVCDENAFRIFMINKCEEANVNNLYIRRYDVCLRNNTYEMIETGRSISCYSVFGLVVAGIILIFCCSYCFTWCWRCMTSRFARARYQPIF